MRKDALRSRRAILDAARELYRDDTEASFAEIAHRAGVGPVMMFASLMWVSGVPYTEAQALRSRGANYRAYQRKTSVLIPWFPKKADA